MSLNLFDISVIIPVYNAEKFVAKAVESALQFPEVKEVLLIEDGSPDDALKVCKKLESQHRKVRLLQHPDKGNHGAGASRNLGLANATCNYIAFLDADDFYLPNRFEADKKVFADNLNADGVYNGIGIHYYSKEAEYKFASIFSQPVTTVNEIVKPEELFTKLIGLSPGIGYFHLDGLTLKKSILDRLKYWFNVDLRLHQDTEFIYRLTYIGRFFPGNIKGEVAKRGVHINNRITNLAFDEQKKKENQVKVWNSIYQWAKTEKLPRIYINHLYCKSLLKTILNVSFFMKWIVFLKGFLFNRNIFMKPLYYNSIHYQLFGKNIFSRILLKLKNKLFNKSDLV